MADPLRFTQSKPVSSMLGGIPDSKHLVSGGPVHIKVHIKGVTHGRMVPHSDGELFPKQEKMKSDSAQIADAGFIAEPTHNLLISLLSHFTAFRKIG